MCMGENSNQPNRREFVASVAVGAAGLAALTVSSGEAAAAEAGKLDGLLAKLVEGNKRFVEGKLQHPGRSPKDFQPLAAGQAPPIAIVSCADSRVPPEVVFDQGVGDLFVVRVAGNVVSGVGLVKGSIEFAVGVLGVKLIMVLGHSECGAVKAAIENIENNDKLPGSIGDVVDPIRPVVRATQGQPGNKLVNVTKANVLEGVKRLSNLAPILSEKVKAGELKVVGGVYELSTGKVELVG